MKTILFVFGTRPEAIKMAPVVLEFRRLENEFSVKVCVTGQHREMLDQVLELFSIRPEHDLRVMSPGQDLFDVTSKVLIGMRDILRSTNPDIVFVHGDTTSSASASLASYYCQIPVAHVEAGLRTNNIYSPWPEEINRQIVSRIAEIHFAPTELSKRNLLKENIEKGRIVVTGNTVIDSLKMVSEEIAGNTVLKESVIRDLLKAGYNVERVESGRKLILITGHRRENFGEGFLRICRAIKRVAGEYPGFDFVYPMHLNPNVRDPISKIFSEGNYHNVFFIEPLEYIQFVYLMNKCHFILTDSGGIQEEAPGLGKPVLVMREITERPEAVEAGTVILVGTDEEKICRAVSMLIESKETYDRMSTAINPYGDGKASQRIAGWMINNYFKVKV